MPQLSECGLHVWLFYTEASTLITEPREKVVPTGLNEDFFLSYSITWNVKT
jgi:hypothetical protein